MSDLLGLGTQTAFGEVAAVLFIGGERYYMMISVDDVVSLIPATALDTI